MTKISLRMEDELYNMIIDYAGFVGIDASKALRELLKEGLMKKLTSKLFSSWQEKIEKRNPFNFEYCDKCGTTSDLQFYHIDGDINNFESNNITVICKGCLRKLQKYIMQYNPREKFLRWFFFDEK